MICKYCGTENPENASFCMGCGRKLSLVCANCGTELPPSARFCFNCGHPVGAAQPPASAPTAASPQLDRLYRYLPPELLAKLQSARRRSGRAGERRVVTMLFCDVSGSTAAAETMDPEEWSEIINGAFEHMVRPVYAYEGTVARLMGDGILAFFGAPIAHEDDPLRAALAGLAIIDGLESYRDEVMARWNLSVTARVGINTGLVVVGEVGSDLRLEYSALGDAINLAARMEQTAQPGTVQITEETYKRIAPYVAVEEIGDIEVKGKREPVRAYRVLNTRELTGVRGRPLAMDAPLAGRRQELQALAEAVARLRQGVGGIVVLVGDAGLGKSRLLRELRRRSLEDPAGGSLAWYGTGAFSFEAGHPYNMFRELLRSVAAIGQDDPPHLVREKLAHLAQATGAGLEEMNYEDAMPLLQALFAIDPGAERPDGELFQRRLFRLMTALVHHLTETGPVVLVFDDLHWVDRASIALLQHLLPLVESEPLLLLLALRPEREAPVSQLPTIARSEVPHRYEELALAPLSADEGSRLVAGLAAVDEIPETVAAHVMQLTGGNPFFIEEVVRELVVQGAIRHDGERARWVGGADLGVTLPDNLHALLMARLDRLEEEERQTLQLAAVIGRHFYYRVLEAVSQAGERLDARLNVLQQESLIREEARIPEREYAFRHALTQETAYRNILRRQRRNFHRQIGEAMEQLFPARREELAPLLALHFARAGDERAIAYSIRAGDRAAALYANAEAVSHYSQALQRGRDTLPPEQLRELYLCRGRSLEHGGQWQEALANYEALEAEGAARGDEKLVLAGVLGQAKLRCNATELYAEEEGHRLINRLLEMVRELDDKHAAARTHWLHTNLLRLQQRLPEALQEGLRAVALARELTAADGAGAEEQEMLAYALNDLGHVLEEVGKVRRSMALWREASQIWRTLDNKPMLADSLSSSVFGPLHLGKLQEAIALSDEAYTLSKSIDNIWNQSYSRMVTGLAYRHLGQMARAIKISEEAIRLGDEAGFPVPHIFSGLISAAVYLDLGAYDRVRERIETVGESVPGPYENMWQPALAIFRGHLYLEQGQVEPAREQVETLQKIVKERPGLVNVDIWLGNLLPGRLALADGRPEAAVEQLRSRVERVPLYAPLARYWLARALRALGRHEEAREALQAAREEAGAREQRLYLWRIFAALAEFALEEHDAAGAARLLADARDNIAYIAEHAPPQLRETFLARPEVRSIMEE